MRSLKIIIFRDTDKPYTIILSAGMLVGISFFVIALASLFTFSIMSNVMQMSPGSSVLAATDNEAAEKAASNKGTRARAGDDAQTGDDPAGDQQDPEGQRAAGDTEDSDYYGFEDPEPGEMIDDSSSASEETEQPEQPFGVTNYTPADSVMHAQLVGDVAISNNSIRFRAQVEKLVNRGTTVRGQFCAVLIDNDGRLGPAYPAAVEHDGNEILNPDRANSFRIGYRRPYEHTFAGIDAANYQAIALYIFEEDTGDLIWRRIFPLDQ